MKKTVKMKKNEAMIMPRNAVKMENDEMMYSDGGYAISVQQGYLVKGYAQAMASSLVDGKFVVGDKLAIAKEIYAHAWAYYNFTATQGLVGVIASEIRAHANPINIGGDSQVMISAFNTIWALT